MLRESIVRREAPVNLSFHQVMGIPEAVEATESTLLFRCAAAAIIGVVSHHGIFKRGEWHMLAPALVRLYVAGWDSIDVCGSAIY